MKTLLIGCTGFIGSEIINVLKNDSRVDLHILTRNKAKKNEPHYIHVNNILLEIVSLIKNLNPDYVINALDDYSGLESRKVIMSIQEQILIALSRIDQVRVVYLSSAAVYGLANTKVAFNETSTLAPINQYGIDKVRLEHLYKTQLERCPNLSVAVLRIFNVIGKNQRHHMMPAAFINDLQRLNHQELSDIWGNRSEYRDYVDVRDVAFSVKEVLFKSIQDFEVYNVSSGQSLSVSEIGNYVLENLKIEFRLPIEKDIKNCSQGDNSKLLDALNWCPRYSIKSSIDYQING
jgi:nucleoside-diphosphate-sugar epimerase